MDVQTGIGVHLQQRAAARAGGRRDVGCKNVDAGIGQTGKDFEGAPGERDEGRMGGRGEILAVAAQGDVRVPPQIHLRPCARHAVEIEPLSRQEGFDDGIKDDRAEAVAARVHAALRLPFAEGAD